MISSEQIIFNSVHKFFSSPESQCNKHCCSNPVEFVINIGIIKKVCGFDVYSNLIIEKIDNRNMFINIVDNNRVGRECESESEWLLSFEIASNKIKNTLNKNYKLLKMKKKYKNLNLSNIKNFLNLLSIIITDEITFNKMTGLIDCNVKKLNSTNIKNLYLSNTNGFDMFGIDYVDKGECCVCWDKTITKTCCSHFICIECASKLTRLTRLPQCPYCRKKNVKFIQQNI